MIQHRILLIVKNLLLNACLMPVLCPLPNIVQIPAVLNSRDWLLKCVSLESAYARPCGLSQIIKRRRPRRAAHSARMVDLIPI
jgi:hypothetical protein